MTSDERADFIKKVILLLMLVAGVAAGLVFDPFGWSEHPVAAKPPAAPAPARTAPAVAAEKSAIAADSEALPPGLQRIPSAKKPNP
ncbi:hypothetical protein [Haloferula sargassicola]|uniref:SPOR domain-containing protein n=1 Tax=Haloferula sargassicola TaxID=490096 RepID=A0ABP9UTZ2_9BACT